VSELWGMLMHIVKGTWRLVKAGESEVALLKDILLVKLWDSNHIGSFPSVVHDSSEALRSLIYTGGWAIFRYTQVAVIFGADGIVVWDVTADALLLLHGWAVLHIDVSFLWKLHKAGVSDNAIDVIAFEAVVFKLVVQLNLHFQWGFLGVFY
jgi:hypothetical protein